MRISIIAMLMLITMGRVMAQQPQPKPRREPVITAPNAIIGELGGRGGFYTVSYERLLSSKHAVAAGLMVWPPKTFVVPLSYTYSSYPIEFRGFVDAGVTMVFLDKPQGPHEVIIIPSLGLGLQSRPYTAGPVFKLSFMVGYMSGLSKTPMPWPWMGLGRGGTF